MQRILLNQHTLKVQRAQQLLEGRLFVGFACIEGGLGDRHTKLPGVERHLSDKSGCAIGAIELHGRTPQGFAVADQLVKILVLISDLGQHPLPQQPKELLELDPFKQIEEGGITGCIGELQIQSRTERLVMASGKTLEIPGAPAATQDAQDRHQQKQPLGVAHPSALTPFRQSLQDGDQIGIGRRLGQGTRAVPTKPAPAWPRQLPCA